MEAATPLRHPRVHVLMGRVIVENVVVDDPATAAYIDRRITAGDDPVERRQRRDRGRRADPGARAVGRGRRVRPQRVREGLTRGRRPRSRTRPAWSPSSSAPRSTRSSARRTGTSRASCSGCSAKAPPPPCSISSARSCATSRRGCAGPAAPVLQRRRQQPPGGLQGRAPAHGARGRDAPGSAARGDARADGRPQAGAAGLRSEREKAADVAAEHARQPPRAAPTRKPWSRRWRRSPAARATTATRSATSAAAAAARATCWSTSRAAPALSPRPDRLRGQELPPLAQGGPIGPGRGDGPARRRLRRLGRCPPPSSSLPGWRGCAKSAATRCSSSTTPRTAPGWPLEVAYSLARARVLDGQGRRGRPGRPALRAEVERALGAMDEVRRIKLHLTNAAGGIEQARAVLDSMAERVRAHLAQISSLVDEAGRRLAYGLACLENRPEGDSPAPSGSGRDEGLSCAIAKDHRRAIRN